MSKRRRWSHARDGCLTDCVARIFNVHPETVPLFIAHKDWPKKLKAYFRRRGMGLKLIDYDRAWMAKHPSMITICVGRSWPVGSRTWHAVLYRGTERFYDPASKQRFIRGRPVNVWLPYRLDDKMRKTIVPRAKVPGQR